MPLVFCAFFDPAFEQGFLFGLQRLLVRFRRRHHFFLIVGDDARPCFTLGEIAGHNRRNTFIVFFESIFWRIQTELRLAVLWVEPVAGETIVRKNRADLLIKIHLVRSCPQKHTRPECGDSRDWKHEP